MSLTHHRWIGWFAIAAAPTTLAGLVLGISLVDWDAEAFRDPAIVLALGADNATTLRVSYLLTALGSYAMLVPLLFYVRDRLPSTDVTRWRTITAAGLVYLVLGAAGACVLGAAIPQLIRMYAEPGADQQTLQTAWHVANRIGEDGLQGMIQNLAGGVWWLGIGSVLRRRARWLGTVTLVLGAASLVNATGSLVEADALQVPGLTVTVLVAPIWSVLMGRWILRDRPALASGAPG